MVKEDGLALLVVVIERIRMVGQRIVDLGAGKMGFDQPLDASAIVLIVQRGRQM